MPDKNYPRIGIVLSSGGVRGVYAHTGFLLTIENLGLPISALAGCSAGALVGGFMASGTPLQRWATTLESLRPEDFWAPDSLWRFIWRMAVHQGRGYSGLSSNDTALRFCRQHLSTSDFDGCRYPFSTLAINLGSGEKTVFTQGELAPRMVASASVPVLYEPMEIDGAYYCDGALVEFAPTDAICCRHHLDVVIVHHVSQHFEKCDDIKQLLQRPWSMLEIVNRLLFRQRPWYLSDEQLTLQRCPCGCGALILAVEPSLPQLHWPLTEGGLQALVDTLRQTEDLLRPYQVALQNDPRGQLPQQAGICDHESVSEDCYQGRR